MFCFGHCLLRLVAAEPSCRRRKPSRCGPVSAVGGRRYRHRQAGIDRLQGRDAQRRGGRSVPRQRLRFWRMITKESKSRSSSTASASRRSC